MTFLAQVNKLKKISPTYRSEFEKWDNIYKTNTRTQGMSDSDRRYEVAFKIAEKLIQNPSHFNKIVNRDLSIGQRLLIWFKNFSNRLIGSKFTDEQKAVQGAIKALQNAIKNVGKTTDAAFKDVNETKFSIGQHIGGEKYIRIDLDTEIQKQFDSATPYERRKIAFEYVKKNLRASYAASDARIVTIDNRGANKITDTFNETKIRLSPELANFIEVGTLKNIVEAKHKIYDKFAYYKVEFVINNNGQDIWYDALLNIGIISQKGYASLYDINPFNKKAAPVVSDSQSLEQSSATSVNSATNNSIRQNTKKSTLNGKKDEKPKYSLPDTDSNGNKLTDAQREFFKDSKVRDEQGRLLTVYHSTPNEFYTFRKRERAGLSGKGIYFARESSRLYGNRLIEAYLNIKNPMTKENEPIGAREINSAGQPTRIIADFFDKFPQFDGIIARQEIVVKDPNQIKLIK
jgi:hypothetical protein